MTDKSMSWAKFHKAVEQKILLDKFLPLAKTWWDTAHNNANLM